MARESYVTFYRGVNLDQTSGNTYFFATRTAQTTFFNSKIYTTVSGTSYLRENAQVIRVYQPIGEMLKCDYLSFKNPQYENKVFYCFITAVNYINDRCTEIVYAVDALQTWLLDINFKSCMIERNHSATDDLFENLLPESFDMGECVVNQFKNYSPTRFSVIFQATFDIYGWINSNFSLKPLAKEYYRGNLFDGYGMCCVEVYKSDSVIAGNGSAFAVIIEQIFTGQAGVTLEDFTNIWLYPTGQLGRASGVAMTSATFPNRGVVDSVDVDLRTFYKVGNPDIEPVTLAYLPSDVDGYIPKNKKMFTYPYSFIHVFNNVGSSIDYRFERFAETDPGLMDRYSAWIQGTTQNEAKIRLCPRNYAGVYDPNADNLNYHGYLKLNLEESIDSMSFPIVSLMGDAYNIYYAQNRNKIQNEYENVFRNALTDTLNYAMGGAIGAGNAYGGSQAAAAKEGSTAASGAGAGGSGGAAMMIGSAMVNAIGLAAKYDTITQSMQAAQDDMRKAPRTASGLQSEGLAFQAGYKAFLIEVRTIDYAHAKMIDDFWSMFGYPVRHIANPGNLLHNRPSWTYIKTAGASFGGNVPESVKSIIEQLFDAGLTFWDSSKIIGDYSQSNAIVTP